MAGRRGLEALPAMLDRIEAWIADGTLSAREPTAADFQIAPSLRLMLTFEDLRPLIEDRPAGRLAMEVAPHFNGHAPPVFPPSWLPR